MNKIKASDYIIDQLHNIGVETIFGYMGGMVTHLAESIDKHEDMKFVQVYHEQTAAFAATGYARHKNAIAVAIATSGPGATNLITGIADAFFDSVPVLFITGQVNAYEFKYDKPIRQLGFQETNIVDMVKPIVKYSKLVDKIEYLPNELAKAIAIAMHGRKGPVLLDLPMNIQREFIDLDTIKIISDKLSVRKDNQELIKSIADKLNLSKSPLVLVGGGLVSASAIDILNEFLLNSKIPFVSSLLGKSACNETLDNYIGTIGSYGNRCANMATYTTDLLLVLGARLDVRQTGGLVKEFAPNAEIIHVDIDSYELKHSRIKNKLNVHCDIREFLLEIQRYDICMTNIKWSIWLQKVKNKYNQRNEIIRTKIKPDPYTLIEYINQYSDKDDVFCADVGQNQMWMMQALILQNQQRFYTSGGLGAMGSALPISLGVAFADDKNRSIYCINGDGGAHMAIQSLMLVSQYNLPIKVIIINNKTLGMITQFQELYFKSNMVGTNNQGGYHVPNFDGFAKAYNLKYYKLDMTNNANLNESLLKEFCESRNGILEYVIDDDCKVYPKLEFDQPIYNPSPKLSAEELIEVMSLKSSYE